MSWEQVVDKRGEAADAGMDEGKKATAVNAPGTKAVKPVSCCDELSIFTAAYLVHCRGPFLGGW